jgi:hypothetical protein
MSEIDSGILIKEHGNCDFYIYVDGRLVTRESNFSVASFDIRLKRLTTFDNPPKIDSTGDAIETHHIFPDSFACIKDKTEVLYSWGES